MNDRVREASPYENIYTVAMRCVHDEGLRGRLSDPQKVKILAQVISVQPWLSITAIGRLLNRKSQ